MRGASMQMGRQTRTHTRTHARTQRTQRTHDDDTALTEREREREARLGDAQEDS